MTVNQDKFSGLSIASLVTGILSVISPFGFGLATGIAAIVCGAIDLKRIKQGKSSQKSRGMNIIGIILGAVGLVINIATLAAGAAWLALVFSGAAFGSMY